MMRQVKNSFIYKRGGTVKIESLGPSVTLLLLLFSRRVFILGPSHHVPLSRCALSPADVYRTPLYDLRIDQKGTSLLNHHISLMLTLKH